MSVWGNWVRWWRGRNTGRKRRARRPLVVEGLEERLVPYAFLGSSWAQPGGRGNPVVVTYSYRNLFDGGLDGVSSSAVQQAIEEALGLWARYAPFTFREVASGQITFRHGSLNGSTVATATSPPGGDVTFDDSDRIWDASLLLEVTVHELGHALGLGHSELPSPPVGRGGPVSEPILNPAVRGLYDGLGSAFLYQDDVNGIRARYGAGSGEVITPRDWIAGGNGNWDTDAAWTRGFEPTLNSDVSIEGGRTVTVSGGPRRARSVTLGGTLHVSGGSLTVRKDLRVGGSGTLLIAGLGTLTVNGNYTQNARGQLNVELGGTRSDVLRVTGAATLGGTLGVSLAGGFQPAPGQTFDVLRAGSIRLDNLRLTGARTDLLRLSVVRSGSEQVLRLTAVEPFAQVIDNSAAGFSTAGAWAALAGQGARNNLLTARAGNGSSVAAWTFGSLAAGTYRVSATWTGGGNRASNAPFAVLSGNTLLRTVRVNQRAAPNDFGAAGAVWENLGTFTISGGTLVVRLTNAANGVVVADAVRIERVG